MLISKKYKEVPTTVPVINLEMGLEEAHHLTDALTYLQTHKTSEGMPVVCRDALSHLHSSLFRLQVMR